MSNIFYSDTTLRDGIQGGLIMDTYDMLEYYEVLCNLNEQVKTLSEVEIFYHDELYKNFYDAVKKKEDWKSKIDICIWVSYHSAFEILQTIPDKSRINLYMPIEVIKNANRYANNIIKLFSLTEEKKCTICIHFEEIGSYDPSLILEFLERFNLKSPSIIQLSDTYGLCSPLPSAKINSIPYLVEFFVKNGIAQERLRFHLHDDSGLSLANAFSAISVGCQQIDGAFFAAGERRGVTALEIIMASCCDFSPEDKNEFLIKIERIKSILDRCGLQNSYDHPLLGTRKKSIDAAKLAAMSIDKFPHDRLLKESSVTLSTGRSGIACLLSHHFGKNYEKSEEPVSDLLRHIREILFETRKSLSYQEFVEISERFFKRGL